MKCFNCQNDRATCYYSPKELTPHNILFCSKCISLIKNQDLSYLTNEEYAKQEVKKLIKCKK